MIQVVIIILFIIFLIYSIRCLNKSETYTINKLYISWENKNYVEESVEKWIIVLVNSDGDELHKIENTDIENRMNFEPVKITFIDDKDFDGKIFGDNQLKVYYNKISDINLVITTNIRFDGTDFTVTLSDIEYADSTLPNKFVHVDTNIARYVWYGYENSTVETIWQYGGEKIILTETPIQTIAVYFDDENITKDLDDSSIEFKGRWEDPSYNIHPVSSSDGPIRKIFKDSPARDNRTELQNATWFKSADDTFHGEGKYTVWVQIDLGKEYPIDKVVVDRGYHGEGAPIGKWDNNWVGTFVKLKNANGVEVARSTDKVASFIVDQESEKTFTFPKKTAKVDCIGIGGDVWGTCSQTCGPNGKQTKTFKISAPARNGGSCPTEYEELPCNRKLCEYDEVTSGRNFEYIRHSPATEFIFSNAKSIIEASEYAVTKTDVTDFTNLKSATGGAGSTQNYVHYWRIKYTYPDSVIEGTWDPGTIKVKGPYSVTIETDSELNQGYVLVNKTRLGLYSSKGIIGGGTFNGGSHMKYNPNLWNALENRYENPYVYIDIFFYHQKDEPTNNDVRILFKGPGMDSSTYDFNAFKNIISNPPTPTPTPTPPPPDLDLDCEGDWSDWSACSNVCGYGTQTRAWITIKEPLGNGKACPSPLTETRSCIGTQVCDAPCEGYWSSYGICDKDCGGGNQSSYWVTTKGPRGNGEACPSSRRLMACNTQSCNRSNSTSSRRRPGCVIM
jgi:hypothetical protein